MRKAICAIFIALMLLHSTTALAGDVPESLLNSDNALVFFGEVVSYDETKSTVTVLPTQKIKGNVEIEIEQTYSKVVFVGEFSPKEEEIYLMTYYDKNNPLYVFQITTTDTKTLKIKGIESNGMMQRLQTKLNDGAYEQKEEERLAKIAEEEKLIQKKVQAALSEAANPSGQEPKPAKSAIKETESEELPPQETVPESKTVNYWIYGAIVGFLITAIFVRKKKG